MRNTNAVMLSKGGASNTPCWIRCTMHAHGILDRPPSRTMTLRFRLNTEVNAEKLVFDLTSANHALGPRAQLRRWSLGSFRCFERSATAKIVGLHYQDSGCLGEGRGASNALVLEAGCFNIFSSIDIPQIDDNRLLHRLFQSV